MTGDVPAYADFRSGLTFAQVYAELHAEASERYFRGQYMFITRATVLGRMRQRKLELYNYLFGTDTDCAAD